jgi:hypothetical protein
MLKGKKRLQVCSIAAIGGLLFGYDTAVISGAIGFLNSHFELNPTMTGLSISWERHPMKSDLAWKASIWWKIIDCCKDYAKYTIRKSLYSKVFFVVF